MAVLWLNPPFSQHFPAKNFSLLGESCSWLTWVHLLTTKLSLFVPFVDYVIEWTSSKDTSLGFYHGHPSPFRWSRSFFVIQITDLDFESRQLWIQFLDMSPLLLLQSPVLDLWYPSAACCPHSKNNFCMPKSLSISTTVPVCNLRSNLSLPLQKKKINKKKFHWFVVSPYTFWYLSKISFNSF